MAAAIFTGPFPGARCHGHFSNGYLSGSVNAQPGDEHLRAIGRCDPNEFLKRLQESIVFGASRGCLTALPTLCVNLRNSADSQLEA